MNNLTISHQKALNSLLEQVDNLRPAGMHPDAWAGILHGYYRKTSVWERLMNFLLEKL